MSMVNSSLVTGSIAVHTQCGERDRRVMASASLTSPAFTALSSAKSSSSWTCVTRTSCKKYRAKAVVWFVSYHGGFLPDNMARTPPKSL